MKHLIYAALSLAVAAPIPSWADPRGMAGTFERVGSNGETIKIERDERGFHVDMTVSTPSCDGHIVGQGVATGKLEVTLRSVPEYASQAICSVRMSYGKGLKAIDLHETNCAYFHGTTCGFNGHVTRVGSR